MNKYSCIGKSCPKYPSEEYFAMGGSCVSGCIDYSGYGSCENKIYGKKSKKGMRFMSSKGQSGGIGFFGLLTIVFIVLKLTKIISWSWWLVLSPLWLPVSIGIFIVFGLGLLAALFKR